MPRKPSRLFRSRAEHSIKSASVRSTAPGEAWAVIDWSNGSSTSGDANTTHMRALLARAERDGVQIRYS